MLYKMLAANPHVIERMLQSIEQEVSNARP